MFVLLHNAWAHLSNKLYDETLHTVYVIGFVHKGSRFIYTMLENENFSGLVNLR